VEKLIILSIVLVSMGVPAWLSATTRPRNALRRAQVTVFLFIIVWGYLCLRWYPRLVQLK
jgi:hypothetical protein